MATVRRLVVGEHLEPGVCNELELVHEPLVGYVANDHHGVRLLVSEPLKRVDECRRVVILCEALASRPKTHMNIAHYTKRHIGLAARKRACVRAEYPVAAKCAERSEPAYEPSSRNIDSHVAIIP